MSHDKLASDMVRSSMIMLLYEKPTHGYNIMKNLNNRLGKNVSPSRVYPFLHQLEEKGLVSSFMEPVGKKPKKTYQLTEDGKKLATTLFKRLAMLVSVAIEPTLDICTHCGVKIFDGAYTEVVNGNKMKFCCVHCYLAYKHDGEH